MNSPYFITNDLESTAGVDPSKYSDLEDIRSEVQYCLGKALGSDTPIRQISYDSAKQYFDSQRTGDEYVIALDGGVYIDNPDYSIDSTRMYPNEASILENPKSYQMMTRDGNDITSQRLILPENATSVGLYDDGIFSGDTLAWLRSLLTLREEIRIQIKVLLNFSWENMINGVTVDAYYAGSCTDWIDERDFYYGVKNSGASINPNGIVSGVPYISCPDMVTKKASIPLNESKRFCLDMLSINQKLWELIDGDRKLADVPRLQYLLEKYNKNTLMQDVLELEKKQIRSTF